MMDRAGATAKIRQKLQRLRSFYHRLPLPPLAKKTLSLAYHRGLMRLWHGLHRRLLQLHRFRLPGIELPAQQPGKPDYIVWGIIDWHFRHQRPQQLAQQLAQTGRRVFYVSAHMTDDARSGFSVEALDASGRLFQIRLFAKDAPAIYFSAARPDTIAQLRASTGSLLSWTASRQIVSLVQHPFWHNVAGVLPNSRLVYDCMDHHEGFGNGAGDLLQQEKSLLREAELTVVSSAWLAEAVAAQSQRQILLRNAGDFGFFSTAPARHYRDPAGRPVIGYYGAIAEWFDPCLLHAVALRFPDCSILLIGADTANVRARPGHLHNVKFLGEVAYEELPYYLHGFNVCLLPFRIIPLTLATNPVKVYEYLSAGKRVVSVDLPEIHQFGSLVRVAGNEEDFLAAVADSLTRPEEPEECRRRQDFAREQTWTHRARQLITVIEEEAHDALVSIIVVTYNNLPLTHHCLSSLERCNDYAAVEIIVVDNHSTDGTPSMLRDWAAASPQRKVILNQDNLGFAAANNQGLAIASGEYLVLLNNDTQVTPGWIRSLRGHLQRNRRLGLVGPVTNNIGNEARIDIHYDSMDDMVPQSLLFTRRHVGKLLPMRTLAFFCVMMPRSTYERIGPLDEAFGRGFFEDDDYCRRIEAAGLEIACAEDVFIHHHLSASFNKLKSEERVALFEKNKAIYEAKWGAWVPHRHRQPGARSQHA
jgi:GT2 family glycosyltransferase